MTVGEFLGQVVNWLYDWWPLRIVRQWEQGIRLYAGEVTKVLSHQNGWRGVHWFVPRLGEIITHECNWEVVGTMPQTLVSADGRSVTVEFAVTYRVKDLAAYYTSIHDQEHTIIGAVRASAGALVPTLAWAGLSAALGETMLASVRARVRGWGLEVKEVVPTTLVHSKVLRLLTDIDHSHGGVTNVGPNG